MSQAPATNLWNTGTVALMHRRLLQVLEREAAREGASVSFIPNIADSFDTHPALLHLARFADQVPFAVSVLPLPEQGGQQAFGIRSVTLETVSAVIWKGAIKDETRQWIENFLADFALDREVEYLGRVAEDMDRLRLAQLAERIDTFSSLNARFSHDANTPLGITRSALEELGEELADLGEGTEADALEYVHEIVGLMQRNVERVTELVGNFKGFTAKQVVQERVDVDLGTADWYGYPGHLAQILLNLFTNCERYAYGERGGKIEIKMRRLKDEFFSIEVRDFGRGIAAENLERVFEQSFTTGRSRGGTGLGLAIVRSLVTESFGGEVLCESTLGAGTLFTVNFPPEARVATERGTDLSLDSGAADIQRFAQLLHRLCRSEAIEDEEVAELFELQRKVATVLSSSYRKGRFRESLRIPSALALRIQTNAGPAKGSAINISDTGMRVVMGFEPEEAELTFECKADPAFSLRGLVVDSRPFGEKVSLGIQFFEPGSESLRNYLLARLRDFWTETPAGWGP
jgi:signal transduction histidine kinase